MGFDGQFIPPPRPRLALVTVSSGTIKAIDVSFGELVVAEVLISAVSIAAVLGMSHGAENVF